jgi:macrophage erythroblast attacher
MRERFQHLLEIEGVQANTLAFSRWADTRLDRWLIDWALRNGREATARQLAREKDISVCLYLLSTVIII